MSYEFKKAPGGNTFERNRMKGMLPKLSRMDYEMAGRSILISKGEVVVLNVSWKNLRTSF